MTCFPNMDTLARELVNLDLSEKEAGASGAAKAKLWKEKGGRLGDSAAK